MGENCLRWELPNEFERKLSYGNSFWGKEKETKRTTKLKKSFKDVSYFLGRTCFIEHTKIVFFFYFQWKLPYSNKYSFLLLLRLCSLLYLGNNYFAKTMLFQVDFALLKNKSLSWQQNPHSWVYLSYIKTKSCSFYKIQSMFSKCELWYFNKMFLLSFELHNLWIMTSWKVLLHGRVRKLCSLKISILASLLIVFDNVLTWSPQQVCKQLIAW